MKVELDLSNYITKAVLKGAKGPDTSNLAAISDIDKIVPAGLSELSNVVDNNIVKKTVYDNLVAKFNLIDTDRFDYKI